MRTLFRYFGRVVLLSTVLLLTGCYRAFPQPSGLVITMPDQSQHLISPGDESHVSQV